jgi:hypothetical protein
MKSFLNRLLYDPRHAIGRADRARAPSCDTISRNPCGVRAWLWVVYVSNGRLFRKIGDGPASEIDTSFAQSIRQRAFEMNRRLAWKTQGRGAKFIGVSGQQGQYVGTGPFSIQALDLDSGQMTCLAEDAKRDFLGPHSRATGRSTTFGDRIASRSHAFDLFS